MTELVPLAQIDPQAVEHLLDRAFGADRRARTAYRIRIGTHPIPELSFAALREGALAGTIQCWPVALVCDAPAPGAESVAMVMVGPVAVEPEWQQDGIGRALMEQMLAVAGDAPLMLIGDPEYYGRFFGFVADRTAKWRLPGPFEARRLLARGAGVPDCAGEVGPRVLAPA